MFNVITNLLAQIIKIVNLLVGWVTATVKLVVGIINIVQPTNDLLVDNVENIGEIAQSWLFKIQNLLKKLGV